MISTGEKGVFDEKLIAHPVDMTRAASTSFNVGKVSDFAGKDPIYPALSNQSNKNCEGEKVNISRRNIKKSNTYKSPYNMSKKSKTSGSSKKRSIESDSKEFCTNPPVNLSDSRYKTQILQMKTEHSCRLPGETNTREESKRSEDYTFQKVCTTNHTDEVSPVYPDVSNCLTQERCKKCQADRESFSVLINKTRAQEVEIEGYKRREAEYKDRIYELEKQYKEVKHKLELSKLEHERQISEMKGQLEKKNDEIVEQMENFIMNKLDLDEYNLTSDDLRSSCSKSIRNGELQIANRKIEFKTHPLVPKLNFQKIFDWREKANNDNIIMIRISESRIVGEDQISEELNDENGIEKVNQKNFPKGVKVEMTSDRVSELLDRKQMIINALNNAYTDDDDSEEVQNRGYDTE
jgi:hypothetical protein